VGEIAVGLLQQIFQADERKKHNLGVCIPDSSKRDAGEEETGVGCQQGFIVTGIFHVHDSLMVKGKACKTIKKNGKVKFHGKTLIVRDVQSGEKNSDCLAVGETGALFLKTEKGKHPIIKIGDVLEF